MKNKRKEYMKEYHQRPLVKIRRKEYLQKHSKEIKAQRKKYRQRPEVKQRQKEYNQRPEVKAATQKRWLPYRLVFDFKRYRKRLRVDPENFDEKKLKYLFIESVEKVIDGGTEFKVAKKLGIEYPKEAEKTK